MKIIIFLWANLLINLHTKFSIRKTRGESVTFGRVFGGQGKTYIKFSNKCMNTTNNQIIHNDFLLAIIEEIGNVRFMCQQTMLQPKL